MVRSYNQVAGRRLDRIGALSDGVFAIAMTLIVFEIHVPDPGPIRSEQDLWNAMLTLGPRLVTYLLSFLTLGIFWNAQQVQINHFTTSDRDRTEDPVPLAALARLQRLPSFGSGEGFVELIEVALGQLDVGCAAVLANVLWVRGFRDRDHAVVADDPGEGDLRGRRVVPLGHAFQDRMRVREQSLLDGRVRHDRAMPLAHPGEEIPFDAAPFKVVQDLVRHDELETALDPGELLHVVDVEVAYPGVADLLRLEEIVES